jgi:hypothetical protein
MKLSAYPKGTVIEINGDDDDRYELKTHWCLVGGWDDDFILTEYVDKLQEDGVKIDIISVPWGVTEQLIEKIWEWQIDAFGSYENDHLDTQDKEAIFEEAVEKYDLIRKAKWLAESEQVRADMRESIEKMRKQLSGDKED